MVLKRSWRHKRIFRVSLPKGASEERENLEVRGGVGGGGYFTGLC